MTITYSHTPAPTAGVVSVQQIDHIVLRVKDPEASVRWYVEKFGFLVHRLEEFRAGTVPFPSVEVCPGQILDLDARAEATGKNVSHFCIVIEPTDLVALKESGVFETIGGPFRRWGALGPADLVYVDDPDGNTIELRHYGPSQVEPQA
ncbi:VOC family protein [Kineosporia succinea]|uniref:Catechol 2,3-dioxygenase-like lactoylglutathione lyase family enzyme n=1 Tax=Kineosporia succinea TaxID=84632 RepID=A0ABT9P9B8_9ACTN|nr:VOC family protein [Kineosporia succinea]MDP9829283.1 catechol 2,3-dioxygenase-like lactoylglutathione lyase family enzyme [Kineosporia succinea]